MEKKKLNLVLEGGGVKGIALIGAIEELERNGCEWECIGGTSAGAIIASLLAVGYTGSDIRDILFSERIKFSRIMDDINTKKRVNRWHKAIKKKGFEGFILKIFSIPSLIPLLWRLKKKYGLFDGKYIEEEIQSLILEKTKNPHFTFADLAHKYSNNTNRLNLMVTDIARKKLFIIPEHLELLNIEPEELEIARAVRLSMAFPFFFTPGKIDESNAWFLDGGVLSNFPYWYVSRLSSIYNQHYIPTIGILVQEEPGEPITGITSMIKALINTMISPLDQEYNILKKNIIRIPIKDIETLDFKLSDTEKTNLYNIGKQIAQAFIKRGELDRIIKEDPISMLYGEYDK